MKQPKQQQQRQQNWSSCLSQECASDWLLDLSNAEQNNNNKEQNNKEWNNQNNNNNDNKTDPHAFHKNVHLTDC